MICIPHTLQKPFPYLILEFQLPLHLRLWSQTNLGDLNSRVVELHPWTLQQILTMIHSETGEDTVHHDVHAL